MNHPRCPHCKLGRTIKHGGKRWLCKDCQRTFSPERRDVRDRAAIHGYVLDRSTYKRLGERWKVHRSTAYRRVKRALLKRESLLDRTWRNLDRCDGVLILDGKWINIQGILHTCFVAWDRGFKRPIHFLLKEGGEKELWYWRLLLDLEKLGYKPKAFVSDGVLSFKELASDRYPDLPHQRCTVHVFLSARSKIAPGKRTNERGEMFVEILRRILWSRTLKEAERRWRKVWMTKPLKKKERFVLEFIRSALPECFVCRDRKWRALNLPRSSNAIENVIGQAEARLKTRRGNKSLEAATTLLNDLFLRVEEQEITHN